MARCLNAISLWWNKIVEVIACFSVLRAVPSPSIFRRIRFYIIVLNENSCHAAIELNDFAFLWRGNMKIKQEEQCTIWFV